MEFHTLDLSDQTEVPAPRSAIAFDIVTIEEETDNPRK